MSVNYNPNWKNGLPPAPSNKTLVYRDLYPTSVSLPVTSNDPLTWWLCGVGVALAVLAFVMWGAHVVVG
jgi:hypothetical protein